MTRAPSAFAICSAKMETPPVPRVSTVWPGRTGPSVTSALQAVTAAIGSAAASSWLQPEGGGYQRSFREDDLFLTHARAGPAERGPRVLAPEAAILPADYRMRDHPVSRSPRGHPITDLDNHARSVTDRNLGQGQTRVVKTLQDQQIPVVEGCGPEANEHLARTRPLGAGLLEAQVPAPKLMEYPALHGPAVYRRERGIRRVI